MGRRKRRAVSEDSGGGGSWLTTYSDLVTLLLCFFILLFSMAIVDKQKFEEVAQSMRAAFSNDFSIMPVKDGDTMISITPYESGDELLEQLNESAEKKDPDGTEDFEDLKMETIKVAKIDIQELIDEMGLNENIKVIEEDTKIILRMDSIILFDSGRAEMKSSAEAIVEKLGQVLESIEAEILVQGHADDRPIHTTTYPSNWELSTRRATNMVKFLIDRCGLKQDHLTAAGNAEFKPIVPNDSEYNRQKNRRIDIIILK